MSLNFGPRLTTPPVRRGKIPLLTHPVGYLCWSITSVNPPPQSWKFIHIHRRSWPSMHICHIRKSQWSKTVTRFYIYVPLVLNHIWFWRIRNIISWFYYVKCLATCISMLNFEVVSCNMEDGIRKGVWCHHQIALMILPQNCLLLPPHNHQCQNLGLPVVL